MNRAARRAAERQQRRAGSEQGPTDASELVVWPASRIAPVIHLDDRRPDPALFQPPSMRVPPVAVYRPRDQRGGRRVFGEPDGGFWTFSWRAGYTAEEFIAEM